jgi:triacylglycerol esterase/lipase EstA (alpha/beta hydrolase family)
MVARLLQIIIIGLVATAAAWSVWFFHVDSPGWALGGALLIVFGYALFLALEFVVLRFVNRYDPAPTATLRQLAGAWWGEAKTAPIVFCWRQPFRANAVGDLTGVGSRRRGVILVHGFFCNRALWNPMMRRLRALGVPFIAVNLEPVFGSIDDYAGIIDAAVRRLEDETRQSPVILSHSMGGLASRAWLDAYCGDARVHRVITVGTPHRGTFFGRFAPSSNGRQMALHSPWHQALSSREPTARFKRFTCFYGHCDNIVFPASTATLPGADNQHIAGCAHVHMAHHEEVFSELLRWVGPVDTDRSS